MNLIYISRRLNPTTYVIWRESEISEKLSYHRQTGPGKGDPTHKKRGETTGEGSGEKKMLNATIYMYNVLHGIALRIFTHFCLTLDSDATAWYAHSRVYNSIHTFLASIPYSLFSHFL